MTLERAQRVLQQIGGNRELAEPIHRMVFEEGATNVLDLYGASGFHLGQLAYQPHNPMYRSTDGLFLSG